MKNYLLVEDSLIATYEDARARSFSKNKVVHRIRKRLFSLIGLIPRFFINAFAKQFLKTHHQPIFVIIKRRTFPLFAYEKKDILRLHRKDSRKNKLYQKVIVKSFLHDIIPVN